MAFNRPFKGFEKAFYSSPKRPCKGFLKAVKRLFFRRLMYTSSSMVVLTTWVLGLALLIQWILK